MSHNPGIAKVFDKVYDKLSDPVSFASNLTMVLLPSDWARGYNDLTGHVMPILLRSLDKIHAEGYNNVQYQLLLDCSSTDSLSDRHRALPNLLRLLFDAGADATLADPHGRNLIQMWCASALFEMHDKSAREIIEDVLTVLIEVKIDVNNPNGCRQTPSMFARYYDCWLEWCQALKRTGKNIEDVLRTEGNSWLLDEHWQEMKEGRPGCDYCVDIYRSIYEDRYLEIEG